MSKWKLVETYDPSKHPYHVLICTMLNHVAEAYFDKDKEVWYLAQTHWTDASDGSIDDVSYWMPLPEPPKETVE